MRTAKETDRVDLSVRLNRLELPNPILVASGTFGYARELAAFVDFKRLGGIIPKTVTARPRKGNPAPRTIETPSGMLNAIGLDNDGIEHFLKHHVPHLLRLGAPLIVNIAGHDAEEFVALTERLNDVDGLAAVELNISCPNVSGGTDFATDPRLTARVVSDVRRVSRYPIIAKLTPNVTDVTVIARAAAEAGADAVSLVNTFTAMAVDWRRQRPILGNVTGGLSGPAIKPLALRAVFATARSVDVPVIGIGGISSLDDVMEFLVAGASAVQIGTANFYDPTVTMRILDELPDALRTLGADRVADVVGTIQLLDRPARPPQLAD
ncbi:MAG: dihydroorotate dehydrogenase [Planctomycetota bacterium]|nr:MAG: dihydroorotate dehydrogenase [Planctomycetota bacterium]